jgi:signal transduction histidine kinase/DNA-binding CsgD family transcriptional regulator
MMEGQSISMSGKVSLSSLREQERQRMARLLEARLGVSLRLLHEQANAYQMSDRANSYPALQVLAGMTGRLLANFNDLAADLDPVDLFDLGLRSALENLAVRLERRYGFSVTLDLPNDLLVYLDADERMALTVYRLVQEGLHNAGQHASAGRVEVNLRLKGHAARLTVADDGCGFVLPQPLDLRMAQMLERLRGEGRWGMAEMVARTDEVNGRFEVTSLPGVGTQVRAYLPLAALVGMDAPPLLPRREELVEPLTARERDVLKGVVVGLTNKQIAVRLGISDRTVQYHLGNLLGKLGVASRTEAAVFAIQHGFLAKS